MHCTTNSPSSCAGEWSSAPYLEEDPAKEIRQEEEQQHQHYRHNDRQERRRRHSGIDPACRAGLHRMYSSNTAVENFGPALAVESSSHPAGISTLWAQPYVYGGVTWNAGECPYRLCLAGTAGYDDNDVPIDGDIIFAAACVPVECRAQDLVQSVEWTQTLQEIATTSTDGTAAGQMDEDSKELWQEYVVLHRRIAEINQFLTRGWTCGNWHPGSTLGGVGIGTSGNLLIDFDDANATSTFSSRASSSSSSLRYRDERTVNLASSMPRALPSSSADWTAVFAGAFTLTLACWSALVVHATKRMSSKRRREGVTHRKKADDDDVVESDEDDDADGAGSNSSSYSDNADNNAGCCEKCHAAGNTESNIRGPKTAFVASFWNWGGSSSASEEEEEEMVGLVGSSVAGADPSCDLDEEEKRDESNSLPETHTGVFINFRNISPTSVMASFLPTTTVKKYKSIDPWKLSDVSSDRFWACLDLRTHLDALFRSSAGSSSALGKKSAGVGPTAALEGLRVLSLLWIIAGHSMATTANAPGVINPADLMPPNGIISSLFGQIFFASRLAVDSFFCISGFLLVHVMEKKQRKGVFSGPNKGYEWRQVPMVLLSRMMRLLPLYACTLGFYILLAPRFHSLLGNGDGAHFPFWYQWRNLLRPCREWYWNMLFANNFLPWDRPTSDTCFYHSWYLAVDMQLFLLAQPILVLLFRRHRTASGDARLSPRGPSGSAGTITTDRGNNENDTRDDEVQVRHRRRVVARHVTLGLTIFFTILTMYLARVRQWSINTLDGGAVARFDIEAYAKPHIRAPSYLAGMYLAMVLSPERLEQLLLASSRKQLGQRNYSPLLIVISLAIMALVVFITVTGAYSRRACQYQEWPQINDCGATWSPTVTWLYTATSRFLWIGALATMLYHCMGRQHFLATFLSWKGWTLLSRLTFAAYLIHPIVLFVLQLGKSEKHVFRLTNLVMLYISATVISFLASLAAVLFVELPAAALWKEYAVQPLLGNGSDRCQAPPSTKATDDAGLLQRQRPHRSYATVTATSIEPSKYGAIKH